jgi:hypothetical protein
MAVSAGVLAELAPAADRAGGEPLRVHAAAIAKRERARIVGAA